MHPLHRVMQSNLCGAKNCSAFVHVESALVIDKLEVNVKPQIAFSGRIDGGYKSLRKRKSDLYKEMIDLRQIGLPALLFLSCSGAWHRSTGPPMTWALSR